MFQVRPAPVKVCALRRSLLNSSIPREDGGQLLGFGFATASSGCCRNPSRSGCRASSTLDLIATAPSIIFKTGTCTTAARSRSTNPVDMPDVAADHQQDYAKLDRGDHPRPTNTRRGARNRQDRAAPGKTTTSTTAPLVKYDLCRSAEFVVRSTTASRCRAATRRFDYRPTTRSPTWSSLLGGRGDRSTRCRCWCMYAENAASHGRAQGADPPHVQVPIRADRRQIIAREGVCCKDVTAKVPGGAYYSLVEQIRQARRGQAHRQFVESTSRKSVHAALKVVM